MGTVTMFTVNTKTDGLGAIFKIHEEYALQVLDRAGDYPVGTKHVMDETNLWLEGNGYGERSRATYINFIQGLAEAGLIDAVPTTGRGGKRNEYRFKPGGYNLFKHIVAKRIIQSIVSAFPDVDFVEVINELDIRG